MQAHILKIAIIDFGNLGQMLAKTLINHGHTILAHFPSPCQSSDHPKAAQDLGVSVFSDLHDLCQQNPQVIFLCNSTTITSTEHLKSLTLQRLKPGTLFVDLLPVKEFSKSLFLKLLPTNFDVVCASPVFGATDPPVFVYDKVRIGSDSEGLGISWCDELLSSFEKQGFSMVEMSCAEHDEYAAISQFITLTVGRVLGVLELESTPINTKGYESLLDLVENTSRDGDSFDLYYELFMYNENAFKMLERLDLAFAALKNQLFGYLHEFVGKQLKVTRLHEDQNGAAAALVSSSKAMRSQNAARPRDHKAQIFDHFVDNSRLKIAIVGFGKFGQFLAKTMVRQGHIVLVYSRSDYTDVAQKLGVSYFSDAADLCESHPEVLLLCTSILSTEEVLRSLPIQRLKKNTLFVDVLSVKEFPRNLLLQYLPLDCDILCTHPMFGPVSGKNGWKGLPFVYDKVRVGHDESRVSRCDEFLNIFAREGCQMVEMSCAEHDKHAAASQFITHTVGRVLEKLGLKSTPIDTKDYKTLLSLEKITAGHSFDLYYGLFMHNINAMEQLKRLEQAFESLKKQVFRRLHGVLHKQIF